MLRAMRLCRLILVVMFGFCSSPRLEAAENSGGSYDGYDGRRDRGGIGMPQVNNANGATNLTPTQAWLNGVLVTTGSAPAEVYVYWGTADGGTNPATWTDRTNYGVTVEGSQLTTNIGTVPGQVYFYRYYATNGAGDDGWASSSVAWTSPAPPRITAEGGATPVGYQTASLNGNLVSGLTAVVHVYWGADSNAWANTNIVGLRSQGPFWSWGAGLSPGSTYYYRCWASNDFGVHASAVQTWTTRVPSVVFAGGGYDGYDRESDVGPIGSPQVNNAGGATGLTMTNAWLNGVLVSTGSAPTQVYVYWGRGDGGTNQGAWTNVLAFGEGTAGAVFATNVFFGQGGLYAYRFYATNSAGEEGWASASASFLVPGPPHVTADWGAAPVSYSTAGLNGNLVSGQTGIVQVVWGMDTNAWSGTNSLGLRNEGRFLTCLTGLNPDQVYYYCCYATNDFGAGWSECRAFTTRVMKVFFEGGGYDGYEGLSDLIEMQILAEKQTLFIFY